ncbi:MULTISPECIES: ArsR/SmtB family transcription factor [unclassified Sedimentibacter]|uniref:ArsR/SmtB family transcription factor n=1 Tax=unclassified Sedimentibacter TaxID=2649220 RepID=UPI0027E0FB4D|nr:metalloregulator ArsR/SmtB family transcription factor [Sedimentibacter sp. MB35-C1]WMJ77436.1 metalloregulator ArsR/SmtB family transcription factor [Sedimentibacter sp. MB35-C1]
MDNFLNIMKAISDENRLKIIELLIEYDFCVGALARQLNISEAAVSQHLKVLRNAGIVSGEKRGYYTHYDVNKNLLIKVSQKITKLVSCDIERKGCLQHLTGDHQYCENEKNPSKK